MLRPATSLSIEDTLQFRIYNILQFIIVMLRPATPLSIEDT